MSKPQHEIEAIAGEGGRAPGSDGERRVAEWARERLVELGRAETTTIEQARCWPRWALAYALHGALAIVGSALSVSEPALGATLVAVAIALTLLDGTGVLLTTRRLLGERGTQNVVSRPRGGASPGTSNVVSHPPAAAASEANVLLVAHCDSGRGREGRLVQPLWWALVAVLACCLLRVAGLDGTAFTAVQFVPTVALIATTALLLEIALSATPEVGDQGRGVQLALALAARHRQSQPNLWIVLTGARHASGQGMRAFLHAHRHELPRERTAIVNSTTCTPVRPASRGARARC